MQKNDWIKAKVNKGSQAGRTIGFPTVNLDAALIAFPLEEGVYAARVRHMGLLYQGALYYGPRLVMSETKQVLEIHIIDFTADIYGHELLFSISSFIRPALPFADMEALRRQISKDIAQIRSLKLNFRQPF